MLKRSVPLGREKVERQHTTLPSKETYTLARPASSDYPHKQVFTVIYDQLTLL